MLTEYYPGDQEKEMGWMGCVTLKGHRGYWWRNLKQDQGIDGRIIVSRILKYGLGGSG